MDLFTTAIDVAKDIAKEVPKDFRAIQNAGQFIVPGGARSMSAIRQVTRNRLGGDNVYSQSAEQNLRDIGRAGLAVGSFIPAGAGVRAGVATAKTGAAALRGAKNLRTAVHMTAGRTKDIRKLKHSKLIPKPERKAKIKVLKANRRAIIRNIPGQAKWTTKQALKTVGLGGKSSALLVPATSPRTNAGVSKRKRLAKTTYGAVKTTYKTMKKLGGVLI